MMTHNDIEKLTVIEKLQAMETLWDALQHDGVEAESPAWHSEVLVARQQKIAEQQASFLDLDELKTKTK